MKKKLNCVLLIDDDEPTNFLSNLILEEVNCASQIKIMQSGKNALEYLANSTSKYNGQPYPELIFLDINMPAMNGWEFLDKYYELSKQVSRKPIIIMLTTSINPDDKIKATRMGLVAGFENKPLTSNMVETLMAKYFND
jgi:CheY-like chemotaxis protein